MGELKATHQEHRQSSDHLADAHVYIRRIGVTEVVSSLPCQRSEKLDSLLQRPAHVCAS
jgi:hypothetical protein